MPRKARLDFPGTLHHIMIRGIARGKIVTDLTDREDFLRRLADNTTATGTTVYAWSILPNHAHLLLRSGLPGLPRFMRRLLTGYALTYNRRHKRAGHLFQNRYQSIVVEEESYFLELVRYIHLNPLRAQLVPDLAHLDRYPWCGHAGILGRIATPWQDRNYVLARFGQTERAAIRAYRQFVADGILQGRRPDLVGGGLRRSLGGWSGVLAVRQRTDRVLSDERILGTGPFVEQMLRASEERLQMQRARAQTLQRVQEAIVAVCQREGIRAEELQLGGRRRRISGVRAQLAVRLVTEWGFSLAEAARHLGVSTSGMAKAVARAEKK